MYNMRQRKSVRLKGYDYSQNGCYFITICTKNRQCLFVDIVDETMQLNEYGEIAESEILKIPSHYTNVKPSSFVVMPNHVHLIIAVFDDNCRQTGAASGAPTEETRITIGNVIRGYKSGVSRKIGYSPWQRNYHDNIIRNDESYQTIATYIDNNPKLWSEDRFYR